MESMPGVLKSQKIRRGRNLIFHHLSYIFYVNKKNAQFSLHNVLNWINVTVVLSCIRLTNLAQQQGADFKEKLASKKAVN
jgi:hypothetical protein